MANQKLFFARYLFLLVALCYSIENLSFVVSYMIDRQETHIYSIHEPNNVRGVQIVRDECSCPSSTLVSEDFTCISC
jgi:hypothetical protein